MMWLAVLSKYFLFASSFGEYFACFCLRVSTFVRGCPHEPVGPFLLNVCGTVGNAISFQIIHSHPLTSVSPEAPKMFHKFSQTSVWAATANELQNILLTLWTGASPGPYTPFFAPRTYIMFQMNSESNHCDPLDKLRRTKPVKRKNCWAHSHLCEHHLHMNSHNRKHTQTVLPSPPPRLLSPPPSSCRHTSSATRLRSLLFTRWVFGQQFALHVLKLCRSRMNSTLPEYPFWHSAFENSHHSPLPP